MNIGKPPEIKAPSKDGGEKNAGDGFFS